MDIQILEKIAMDSGNKTASKRTRFLKCMLQIMVFPVSQSMSQPSTKPMTKSSQLMARIAIAAILFLLDFIVLLQNPLNPFSRAYAYSDYAVYLMAARTIVNGGMPYVDMFDHKGPVFYLINALGYLINQNWGIWLIELVGMFFALIFAYRLMRIFLGRGMSLLIVVLSFSGMAAWGYWIGNTPESQSLPIQFASTYVFVRYFIDRQSKERRDHAELVSDSMLVALGAGFAFILLMKPTIVVGLAGYGFLIVAESLYAREFKQVLRYVSRFMIGMAVVMLSVLAWIWAGGAMQAFINQYIVFNVRYSTVYRTSDNLMFANSYYLLRSEFTIANGCTLMSLLFYKKIDRPSFFLLLRCLLITAIILTVILFPGRPYQHYSLMAYPSLMILIGLSLAKTAPLLMQFQFVRKILPTTAIVTVLLVIAGNTFDWMINVQKILTANPDRNEVIQYIKENTDRQDGIAVMTPDDCWIYVDADRDSSTTYPYTQWDIILDKLAPEMLNDYVSQINATEPALLITQTRRDWYMNGLINSITVPYQAVVKKDSFTIYKPVRE